MTEVLPCECHNLTPTEKVLYASGYSTHSPPTGLLMVCSVANRYVEVQLRKEETLTQARERLVRKWNGQNRQRSGVWYPASRFPQDLEAQYLLHIKDRPSLELCRIYTSSEKSFWVTGLLTNFEFGHPEVKSWMKIRKPQ
jgi:hypothetical protein